MSFMAKILTVFILLGSLLAGVLWLELRTAASPEPDTLGYPAPRYPKIPRITSVEELLPNAKIIIQRPMPYSGNQFPGYEVKGGEKILFVVSRALDPLVIEAFERGFKELNCTVDTLITDATLTKIEGAVDMMERVVARARRKGPGSEPPLFRSSKWLMDTSKAQGYDKVIGITYRQPENDLEIGYGLDWVTREMLADASVKYPMDLLKVVDEKGWERLRQARQVHLTDPEGTDYRFTWLDEYWQVVEGLHPTLKVAGSGTHIYGPGRSEIPLIQSHLMGHPQGVILDKSDGEGVIQGASDHMGPYPHLKIAIKRNQVVSIEGGGRFGELWREFLELTKDIQYPHYPEPGSKYLMESAIGTHPWIVRPHNVFESQIARRGWIYERNRSGVIHVGIGQLLSAAWASSRGLPGSHFHVHLYFPTYVVKTRDGGEQKVIDKGRLVALDHPEVRTLAAKYGNPDELLREAWIPAIPGINVPGDYFKDYANDPVKWIRQEHRQAYGSILDFKPYP
ncbi:MAG: hypothetical protein HY652_12170 [Acidobacteria bacterium]|nr:hypothetical protein [Acidobacteriota bacterium]